MSWSRELKEPCTVEGLPDGNHQSMEGSIKISLNWTSYEPPPGTDLRRLASHPSVCVGKGRRKKVFHANAARACSPKPGMSGQAC